MDTEESLQALMRASERTRNAEGEIAEQSPLFLMGRGDECAVRTEEGAHGSQR